MAIAEATDRPLRKRLLPFLTRVAAVVAALVVAGLSFWLLVLNQPGQQAMLSQQEGLADLVRMSGRISPVSDAGVRPGLLARLTPPQRRGGGFPAGEGALNNRDVEPGPDPLQPGDASDISLTLPDAHLSVPTADSYFAGPGIASATGSLPLTSRLPAAAPFSLGAHFAPQSNYRIVSGGQSPGGSELSFDGLEEQIMTWSAGLSVYFDLSGKWAIQSGLHYTNMGQYVRDIVSYAHPAHIALYETNAMTGRVHHPQSIITSQGSIRIYDPYHYFADAQSHRVLTNRNAISAAEPRKLKKAGDGVTQVFRFVEVPLIFRYRLYNRGVGLQLKGGFSGGYLMENNVYLGTDILRNPIGETFGVRQFNFSAIGGVAMAVPITGSLTFHMEPTAQIFLSPMVHDALFTGRTLPYNFSLQTGVSYGF